MVSHSSLRLPEPHEGQEPRGLSNSGQALPTKEIISS